MKVAFVTAQMSRAAGGLRDAVGGAAFALADHGSIDVAVFGLSDPAHPRDSAAWGPRAYPHRTFGPLALGLAPALDRALLDEAPDVTDAHGIWTFVSLANLRHSRATRHPYIVTPHGMLDPWALRRSTWKKRLAAALFESAHLQRAACIRAIADAEVRAVRAYGCRNPVALIPNAVQLPDDIARRNGDGDKQRLLFFGRIDPKKGVEELVRAWAMVQGEALDRGWHLQVTGWGKPAYVERLRCLAIELNLTSQVFELTGPAFGAEKTETFRGSSAFILPSYSEGLPMAALEAWSYGLPTLLTPNCNLPEGVAAAATLSIDSPTPKAIAESVRTLMTLSDGERHAIGDHGRRLVERRFNWATVAQNLAQTYAWVLGGGPRPDCVIPG